MTHAELVSVIERALMDWGPSFSFRPGAPQRSYLSDAEKQAMARFIGAAIERQGASATEWERIVRRGLLNYFPQTMPARDFNPAEFEPLARTLADVIREELEQPQPAPDDEAAVEAVAKMLCDMEWDETKACPQCVATACRILAALRDLGWGARA